MYTMRDIYQWYPVLETTEKTIPIEQQRKDPAAMDMQMVTPQDKQHIWVGLIVLVGIIIFLNTKI